MGRNKSGRPGKEEGTRIRYLFGHFHRCNLMGVVSVMMTNYPEKLHVMLSHVHILYRKWFLPLLQDEVHSRNVHKNQQHNQNAHKETALHCKARSSPPKGRTSTLPSSPSSASWETEREQPKYLLAPLPSACGCTEESCSHLPRATRGWRHPEPWLCPKVHLWKPSLSLEGLKVFQLLLNLFLRKSIQL